MARPSHETPAGSRRMRRLVATLFAANALALIVDGWAGEPRWVHYGLAWPLTIAFAVAGLLHGAGLIRAARTATD